MAAAYRNEPEILPFLAVDGAVCRVQPASKSLSDDVSGASRKAAAKTRAIGADRRRAISAELSRDRARRERHAGVARYRLDRQCVRSFGGSHNQPRGAFVGARKPRLFADRRQSLQAAHLRIVQAAEVIGVGPQIAVYQRPGETVAEAELGLDRGRRAAANGFR